MSAWPFATGCCRHPEGADAQTPDAPPEPAGPEASAAGFRVIAKDDHENTRLQFPLYDPLHGHCRGRLEGTMKLEYAKSKN